jgi:diguanylate cyclase (GGDEF)-like protein
MNRHEFAGSNRFRAVAFAVLGNVVPIGIATAANFGSHKLPFFIGAVGACLAPLVVTGVGRRVPLLFYPAAFGGLLALTLMQWGEGGVDSGNSVLLMMAMIWFGLQGTDRELLAAIATLAACSFLPMLAIGAPAFPVDWAHASLIVVIGVAVSGSLRSLARGVRELTSRLEREAVHDELTGLLNRRGWGQAVGQQLPRAARTGQAVGVVMVDLDGLKRVNDELGHAEGDRLLRNTAERMRSAFRAGDILARLGGDEFAVLLVDPSMGEAAIDRLRELTPRGEPFSAGLAIWNGSESLEELMHRADLCLYQAKAAGGGALVLDAGPVAAG